MSEHGGVDVEPLASAGAVSAPGPEIGGAAAAAQQIRGSSLLLAGQAISVGVSFFTQVLMIRYLTKSDYGAFAYALSVVLIAQGISTLALNRSVARFVAIHHEQREFGRLLGTVAVAVASILMVGLATVGVTFAVLRTAGTELVDNRTAITVLSILIVLAPIQALDDLLMSLFAVFSRIRTIFLRTYVVTPGLKLLVVLILIAAHSNVRFLAAGFVLSGFLGLAVFVGVFVSVLRREGVLDELQLGDAGLPLPVKAVFAMTIPLLVADLAYGFLTSIDGVLLGHFRGTEAVAAYKAVQPAARLMEFISTAFLILFTPLASRLYARRDVQGLRTLYWRTAAWVAVLTFPLFLVTFAFAKPVTVLLFGDRYADSAVVLAVLSLGSYVQVAVGFNGTALMVMGKMRQIVGAGIAAVIVAASLDVVLIPRYGAVGAAIATATALAFQNALKQVALRFAGGIPGLDRQYVKVYATIVIAAAVVAVLNHELSLRAYVGFPLAAGASLLVIVLNRREIMVVDTFPELRRFRLARYVFGE